MIQKLSDHDREKLQESLATTGQKVTPQREIVFAVLLTLLLNAFALALFFVRTIHLQLRTHAIGVHLSELVHAKV